MNFVKKPKKQYTLRSDCCGILKDENDQCISIKINTTASLGRRLRITLLLKTIPNTAHFFKLFKIDGKGKISKQEFSEIFHNIKTNDEVELNFFGIKKATKEQAKKFIQDKISTNEVNEIIKQNSTVCMLSIELLSNENEFIARLLHELKVGNQCNESIEVIAYAPKILTENDGITFALKNPIKDEKNVPIMIIESDDNHKQEFKNYESVTKNVIFYPLNLSDLSEKTVRCQLINGISSSEYMNFSIKKQANMELLKRKSTSPEEFNSNVKVARNLETSLSHCSSTESSINNENINNNIKQTISDKVITKVLREIACSAHNYASNGTKTEKQWKIIQRIPVVCILQDELRNSPLHYAILNKEEDTADFFVNVIVQYFPTEINASNIEGNTPLILSVISNLSIDFIQKLVFCGADLLSKTSNNLTVFDIAINLRRTEIINLLLQTAKYRNLFCQEDIISLVKNVVNQEYFDGYKNLFDHFRDILLSNEIDQHFNDQEIQINAGYQFDSILFNNQISESEIVLDYIDTSDFIGLLD